MTRLKAAYGASFSAAKQTALLLQTLCGIALLESLKRAKNEYSEITFWNQT